MRDILDRKILFYQPKILMAIFLTIVLLLYHLETCSTGCGWGSFWFLFGFLVYNLFSFLKKRFHFLFNLRINLYCFRDVNFHRLWLWHSFVTIPSIPFALSNKVHHGGLWCATISNSCLFVQSINDKFLLVW